MAQKYDDSDGNSLDACFKRVLPKYNTNQDSGTKI